MGILNPLGGGGLNPLWQHFGALQDFLKQAQQSGNKSGIGYFQGQMDQILKDPEMRKQLGDMFDGGDGAAAGGDGGGIAAALG